MKTNIALLASLAFAVAGSAAAKGGGDSDFVMKAAQGGMEEVELGKLASSKGANASVKQFGDRMVSDHSKANDELKMAAQKDNVTVPSELSKKQQDDVAKLNKLDGAAFDKAYAKMMVSDHKEDISLFEKEAKSGKDANVKAFAQQTLPTLQEHLRLAQAMEQGAGTAQR
jgi:putative membrane protein